MKTYRCELHVHSCLSPCADDDMTPYSIAGMAKLNGLHVVALTDHNSCKNCETFFAACERYGIIAIAGMELTTAEDIHLICLFPDLERAYAFDNAIQTFRIPIKNKPQVFGRQLLIGMDDEIVGEETNLLINATQLPLSESVALARSFDAAVYPAHIDREANGIIAILGTFPKEPKFTAAELRGAGNDEISFMNDRLDQKRIVTASDAHRLCDLSETGCEIPLECEGEDAQSVRNALIAYLRGK